MPPKAEILTTASAMKLEDLPDVETRMALHDGRPPTLVDYLGSNSDTDLANPAYSEYREKQVQTEAVGSNTMDTKFKGIDEKAWEKSGETAGTKHANSPPRHTGLLEGQRLPEQPNLETNPDGGSVAAGSTFLYDELTQKLIYGTPFVEKVEQIRNLYHHHGCPPRPKRGVRATSKYMHWESQAKMVLGVQAQSSHHVFRNIEWAIFGGDENFNLWKVLCHAFVKGTIPDGDGAICPAKQGRVVHSAFFKNLDDGLSEPQILSILTDVKNHKVLLTNTSRKSTDGCRMDSINDAARKLKNRSFAQCLFLCKLKHDFQDETGDIVTWEDLVSKCPGVEYNFEFLLSLLHDDIGMHKRKTLAPDLVPEACAIVLRKLWSEIGPLAI